MQRLGSHLKAKRTSQISINFFHHNLADFFSSATDIARNFKLNIGMNLLNLSGNGSFMHNE